MEFWAGQAVVGGTLLERVSFAADAAGLVSHFEAGTDPRPGATRFGLIAAGLGNAHSHAFHRRLRGRTNGGGGDFWRWREAMYREAAALTPDSYEDLAERVFCELLAGGYTAVGEFQYIHHRPDGRPYEQPHAMEMALVRAAQRAGIRLVLLDTCYLAGGIGRPLESAQARFSDGTAEAWLDRLAGLRQAVTAAVGVSPAGEGEAAPAEAPAGDNAAKPPPATQTSPSLVTIGAAVHSVRAVPRTALDTIAAGLPQDLPLHIHLSEQPAENQACQVAYGLTPAALLAYHGLLSPRTALVHATHLAAADFDLLVQHGCPVVMCPGTEADLGDGIGPAAQLAQAGVGLAIGSDQNLRADGLAELCWLEYGQRLATGRRGLFTPGELWRIGQAGGYGALGLAAPLTLGGPCDFFELDPTTARAAGAEPLELVLVAGPGEIRRVVVGGQVRRP
ncbi:MAG: amidohydrolase family protein [Bifidobacteriaceae bacterium]|jgi:cytosine/adenosine deaminase-related metal-dependent hydrolase|nr:amidohydrolase family protein [Bifidobacteriaceae bacterium]